ncbi:hypothetical protein BAUCODRAFT_539183 [Baudoinia panamericana UAMH 10762]|uniref:Methyltransferase domain-containing protein n=1 Tax=Baudoinia panamericana (strain UAMH 10762) TaxID=717646 RepID=M2N989_BAUPA|nr:uncharacterized protein BAUCODRAFT_539183 [Baudoinia panamericana UAMH 10762]EMC95385.1 hypothetical protein BAUCODRAFT_539183 [Baudoinia panamericana UAMH 10762]
MASSNSDIWSAEKYKTAASFVPALTTTVVKYLDVQPHDHILDIGCGDGTLTTQLAKTASSGRILGLDASQSFIASAQKQHTTDACSFKLQDCTQLDACSDVDGSWDKVFSNAALHWILRKPDTRVDVFRNAHKALKSGGRLVFEMGGAGNVAEVQAACTAASLHCGLSISEAREANPWFFPSVKWMEQTLADVGFSVEICELEYRPTKLNPDTPSGEGGLIGWLKLLAAPYITAVPESKREAYLQEVCDVLDPIMTHEEDGTKWMGYTRLRAVARKP